MENGKNKITSLVVTGVFVVVLALASLIYPKLSSWYENLVNGTTATPVPTNSGNLAVNTPTESGNQGSNSPTSSGNQSSNTSPTGATIDLSGNDEPVTITDVPLAEPTGNGGAIDFYFVNSEGKTVRLSDFYGKPIVVNIWATWCGYCKEEFPLFNAALKKYGDQVQFLFIDLCDGVEETRAKADKYMKQNGYNFPVYYETLDVVLSKYNVGGIPFSLFIDADGIVYKSKLGSFTNQNTLYNYIEGTINNTAK